MTTTAPTEAPVTSAVAPTAWRRVAALSLGIGALVTLALIAFAWPATHSTPHDLDLALVAPEPQAESLTEALETALPGAFDVSTAGSTQEAQNWVADGTVDGAIALGEGVSPQAIVAGTASNAAKQLVVNGANVIGAQQAAQAGLDPAPSVTVTDVAPLPEGDPRGTAIPAAMLPLFIAGMVTGAAALLLVRRTGRRVALAVSAPVAAGLGAVLVLQTWLNALGGGFLAQWGAFALGAGAIAVFLVGAVSLMGRTGFSVVTLLMLLLGNPLSAAATGPAFLPAGWAALGQLLPPGAAATTMRDIAAYGSAGTSAWVLAGWVAIGGVMIAVGAHRRGHDPMGVAS